MAMNIGEAAQAAGVSTKMIRHYEQIGLLPEAARTEGGYRQYGPREVSVLRFIRQSRQLGFSIEQIGELLGLWSDRGRASREVKALAEVHLAALDEKLRELTVMRDALQQLVQACPGDEQPHCAILDQLAVASSDPPPPEALGCGKPKTAAKPSSKAAAGSAHAELMAWTRMVHQAHPPG